MAGGKEVVGRGLQSLNKMWNGLGPKGKAAVVGGAAIYGGTRLTDQNAIEFVINTGRKFLNFNDDEQLVDQVGRSVVDGVTAKGEYDSTMTKLKNFFGGGSSEGAGAGTGESQSMLGGLFGGITNGLKNLMSGVFGGITNFMGGKLPMLLMLPLAWLAFSKFGWLGKIGGLLLGVFAASSLFSGNKQSQSRQVAPVVSGGSARERFNEKMNEQQQVGTDLEDAYTVHRGK